MATGSGPRLGKSVLAFALLVGVVAVAVAAIAVAVAMTQGNGTSAEPIELEPTPTAGADEFTTEVEMTVGGWLAGTLLTVQGEATVPDGAFVRYRVTGPEDCAECESSGRVSVRDGKYSVVVDVAGWGDGPYVLWAAFQTQMEEANQPDLVLELYGEEGELMTGDTVTAEGLTRVEAEATFEP